MDASESKITPKTLSKSMGALLIDNGLLTPKDAEKVIKLQHAEPDLRFGDAAIRLGLVTQQDVLRALAEQFTYSYLASNDDRVCKSLVTAFQPFSEVAEHMRILRTHLLVRWFNTSDQKTITVVSPSRGDGKSFVAANLAVVFSQLGEKTLLIDCNLRTPVIHERFKLPNKMGISTLLAERSSLTESIAKIVPLPGLSVMPSGPIPPNPHELISRERLDSLFQACRKHFDIIIVDSPIASQYPDAYTTAVKTGGALVVARQNITPVVDLKALASQMRGSGVHLVGSIFNQF